MLNNMFNAVFTFVNVFWTPFRSSLCHREGQNMRLYYFSHIFWLYYIFVLNLLCRQNYVCQLFISTNLDAGLLDFRIFQIQSLYVGLTWLLQIKQKSKSSQGVDIARKYMSGTEQSYRGTSILKNEIYAGLLLLHNTYICSRFP